MSNTVKIKMTLATRFIQSEVSEVEEIDKEEWDSMSEDQKGKLLDDLYQEFLTNNNYGGISVVE